jgi:hypothetical protein
MHCVGRELGGDVPGVPLGSRKGNADRTETAESRVPAQASPHALTQAVIGT